MFNNINFIPTDKNILHIKNISPSSNNVPDWYKKSSQYMGNENKPSLVFETPMSTTSTYKRCSPFLDALTSGYTISLPADIQVFRDQDNIPYIRWRSDELSLVSDHSNEQVFGLKFSEDFNEHVFKWEFRFIVQTPPGYSTIFMHPVNRFDLPFQTFTGVVDTDGYPVSVQFPFILKDNFSGIIEAGTPIVQFLPFKREKWNSSYSEYDDKNRYVGKHQLLSKIVRSYKNQWWNKKVYQ